MLNILLLICGLILVLMTLIVLYSNYKSAVNLWLSGFLISGFLWVFSNYLTNISHSDNYILLFSRTAIIGGSLISYTYLMFCYEFTGKIKNLSKSKILLIFLPILFLLAIEPTRLNIIKASESSITTGYGYILLMLVLVLYFAYGFILLLQNYFKSEGNRKRQIYYALIGTVFSFIPGIILNGIFPIIGNPKPAEYGSFVVISFATFTSIAIIKHRLLDIKLVIIRSLAYVVSILIFALTYMLLVSVIFFKVIGLKITFTEELLLALLIAIITPIFSRLQKYFVKITNSIFFREIYDTQLVLDKFNKNLVSSYEIRQLFLKSSSVIEQALNPNFIILGIRSDNSKTLKRGISSENFENLNIDDLLETCLKYNKKVISVDEINESQDRDKQKLTSKGIAILVRLTPSLKDIGIGYIIIGSKKGGNMYSNQDIGLIEIMSNELFIAIQNLMHFEEIQNFNITLQQRVDDATRKLRRTNEKLKALDESKDDFISMASHQLRTPLTSVKGYISMMLEGDGGKINTTQKTMLNQAFFSAQRMVYLIADLLNVSRLKSGKFVIEPKVVDLSNLVSEEMGQMMEIASSKNQTLTYNKPKNFPKLNLDETKTRQVVMNYIDNALYYTPQGGKIDIVLEDKPETVELRVVDNGIGVPKAEQHHLFTKFYRAENARKVRPDGTGLGLFMAKKVIAAEGGAIIFESQEGKGSTFGFTFSKNSLEVKTDSNLKPKK